MGFRGRSIVIGLWLTCASAWGCATQFQLWTYLAKRVEANNFIVSRELKHYEKNFPTAFTDELESLSREAHWVDAGAGEASAMYDYAIRKGNRRASLTAIAKKRPSLVYPLADMSVNDRFTYLDGKLVEELDVSSIKPVDLLTDMFGPFSYSRAVDVVLCQYAKMMKVGASVFLHPIPQLSQLKLVRHGWFGTDVVPLAEWLGDIEGMKIESINEKGIHLRKIADVVQIPQLNFERLGHPNVLPLRIFEYPKKKLRTMIRSDASATCLPTVL